MSVLKLSNTHKRLIQKASRSVIEDHFASFPQTFRSNRWLNKTNRYRYSCISIYTKDIKPLATSLNHAHLAAYIGASSPTHVIDGWSYLGRAVEATLRGDAYAATHLAYYAELRAAMGLLASEGIGVFSNRHAIVVSHNAIEVFKGAGTHKDIWPILRHWATLRRATDLLDDLIMPNSIRLSTWLTQTGVTIPVRAVAQHWLKSWGVDLGVVDDDHDCRNLASYRPSEFRRPERLNVYEQTSFVEELWQLFEPSAVRRFPSLESHLLKNAWRKGNQTLPSIADLENLGLTQLESSNWAGFFQQLDDPSPFKLAERWVSVEDPTCHLRIISRAAFLLFIASAAAKRLLSTAGYSSNDLLFWWGRHGEDRALWDVSSVPNNPQDLWADIAQSIADSGKYRNANPVGSTSLHEWRKNQTNALIDFGGFELAGIWALMP